MVRRPRGRAVTGKPRTNRGFAGGDARWSASALFLAQFREVGLDVLVHLGILQVL